MDSTLESPFANPRDERSISHNSMDFFDSGGVSCRILYRMNGLEGAVHLLNQLVREVLPIVRINILSGSTDLRVFVPIVDTLPGGLSKVREAGASKKSYPIVAPDASLTEALVLNDLSLLKAEAVRHDPTVTELPFFSHEAVLRLPLFVRGAFVFLLNFWANEKDVFQPEHVVQLTRLTRPLAEELAGAFTGVPLATPVAQEELNGYARLCRCAGLLPLRASIEKAAPANATILITGETGVGKELVAEAIHELSERKSGPLVRVNCGAIAPSLLESELFGYEKGAFTGAQARRSGYFEYANGGTLFLDEIGELPLTAQVQLLRVLDRKTIQRVGDPQSIPIDVRVVAATNRNLQDMVEAGTFRRDLYYRLSVYPVHVPSLRQRKVDILPLVRYFITAKAHEMRIPMPPDPAQSELDKLYRHDWPGNIRELENVVERALIDSRTKLGTAPLIFSIHTARSERASLIDDWPTLQELEKRYIQAVLEKTAGRLTGKQGAAPILGIHYTTLKARLDETRIMANRGVSS